MNDNEKEKNDSFSNSSNSKNDNSSLNIDSGSGNNEKFNTGASKTSHVSNKKHLRKRTVLIIILVAVMIACLMVWKGCTQGTADNGTSAKSDSTVSESPSATENSAARTVDYDAEKAQNSDYVGHLFFESGLIDELTVQSADNEYYLTKDFNKTDQEQGTVFMDYRNSLDDQNMIFYGHFVYYDESKKFSPLHQLKDQNNYEANEYFDLELQNETRRYQVAYVFYYEMDNENMEYWHLSYTQNDLDSYLPYIESKEFYSTGVSITEEDKFVTLQTCVRDRDDLRLIVIGKQISETAYSK